MRCKGLVQEMGKSCLHSAIRPPRLSAWTSVFLHYINLNIHSLTVLSSNYHCSYSILRPLCYNAIPPSPLHPLHILYLHPKEPFTNLDLRKKSPRRFSRIRRLAARL